MAGGWRNPIMQDETGFIICESLSVDPIFMLEMIILLTYYL